MFIIMYRCVNFVYFSVSNVVGLDCWDFVMVFIFVISVVRG